MALIGVSVIIVSVKSTTQRKLFYHVQNPRILSVLPASTRPPTLTYIVDRFGMRNVYYTTCNRRSELVARNMEVEAKKNSQAQSTKESSIDCEHGVDERVLLRRPNQVSILSTI